MPKYEGVYDDGRGGWYFKANFGRDPLSGKKQQVTKRGFPTATAAARARRQYVDQVAGGRRPGVSASAGLTVNELLDWYLDGLDADGKLSPKTRFDYRANAAAYVRPWMGEKRLRDVTAEAVVAWQRRLAADGGRKRGQELSNNTIRLARAPLAGAFKAALAAGLVSHNPVAAIPRPTAGRSVPRHWSPEQAREFLRLEEGDRMWPVWAFLLGSGLRIGELIWLRWANVDLERRAVRVVEFASTLGYDLQPSTGKSRDAVRTIDLDDGLVRVLRLQRKTQREERASARASEDNDFVFTRTGGGFYHPQTISQMLGRRSQAHGLPRLTAHGFRHTSATLMLANGVPPKVAAERLGHADATLFSNLYSHVTPTMQREAADRIGRALFDD